MYLRGIRVPFASRLVHHDYPVTPGIWRELARARPDVVVVSGWSTFAAQAALLWCRARRVPYLLLVVSHDIGPRAGWRALVKGAVVPRLVRGAAGVLVVGALARRSVLARGARPERVRVFANTVDVEGFGEQVDRLAGRRRELRGELGLGEDDVVVVSVARLAPEKRHDLLIRAVAAAADPRLVLLLVGDGPERGALERLAASAGVRLVLAGDRSWERIVETYVAADVFALLSERETWGVVVNEAAACGLPLVLSDQVGAAADLLVDGENGSLVPAGDVAAAAAALSRLAQDRETRLAAGARSRRARAELGLRAVRRGLRGGRPRGCGPVDLLLQVRDAVPRQPPRRAPARLRQAARGAPRRRAHGRWLRRRPPGRLARRPPRSRGSNRRHPSDR